jgi:Prokaryotic glutathione synthetase, ATP-grasp domain.
MFFDYYGQENRNIFICNFDCENYWSETKFMRLPSVDLYKIKSIIQNLDELFIFLARKEDVLVLRKKPDDNFIHYLQSLDVDIPHILTVSSDDEKKSISQLILADIDLINALKHFTNENLKKNIITNLIPYGVTTAEEKLSNCINTRLLSNSQTSAMLNCKLTLKELSSQLNVTVPESIMCEGSEELQNIGMAFVEKYKQVVIKELFGSGGSGLAKVNGTVQFKKIIEHMKRFNNLDGKIILEKWHTSKISYNHQYVIMNGSVYPHAFSKQLINSKSGNIMGSIFYQKPNRKIQENHYILCKPILDEILQKGYQGLIGFDSIICNKNLIFPIVDINCRVNLSTIFYEVWTRYFSSVFASFFCKEYMLDEPMSFVSLIEKISSVAYSFTKKEGIIILNFTSLNTNILNSKGKIGRVFYGIFARSEQRAKEICEKVFFEEDILMGGKQ